MRKCFYINGKSSADFHVFINSDTYLNAPQIDFTEYNIPSVNGSFVAYNKRLENVERRFDCYIKDNIDGSLNTLKKLLYSNPGYVRIESDYDPETYQFGFLSQPIEVSPWLDGDAKSITFSLYFSCRPQKYIKSVKEVTSNAVAPSLYYNNSLTRNSGFIQSIFSKIPIENVPNDLAFMLVGLGTIISQTTSSFTLSCEYTEGDSFVCAVGSKTRYPREATDLNEVFSSSFRSLNNVSFTPSKSEYVFLIVPVKLTGSFTYSYSENGGTTVNRTISELNALDSFSDDATGAEFDNLTVKYSFNDLDEKPTSFVPNALYLASFVNGEIKNEATVSIRFDRLSSDLIDLIYNSYASLGDVNININLVDYTAELISGTKTINFNDYLEINGNINGIADEVKCVLITSANYPAGAGVSLTIAPRWWIV